MRRSRSKCAAATRRSTRRSSPGPARRARETRTLRLTLLVRAYCHLCDEMRTALAPLAANAGAAVVEIDVDTDAALEASFGERVPVLLLGKPDDGRELCHYALDRGRVLAALAQSK